MRQPLIAIGKWAKKGWLITEFEEQSYLRKDEVYIALRRQRNFETKDHSVRYMMDISDELKQLAGQPGSHGTPALVVQSALTFQDVSQGTTMLKSILLGAL